MVKNSQKVVGGEIVNFDNLSSRIYTVRGTRVMLDYDLAEIYGYETKNFNRQVRNNIDKFEGEEFMFQLTWEEVNFLRCKNCTLKGGRGEHFKYLPYAFTEQGIYMLMTVLKGDLAIKQSRALVMTFKVMKDCIVESNYALQQKEQLQFMMQIPDNFHEIKGIESEVGKINHKVEEITKRLGDTVTKSEISDILLDFAANLQPHSYIIFNGQPAKASEVYRDIYGLADKSLIIVDDYIDIKTLRHLQKVKSNVRIIVLSDNKGRYLSAKDYRDFRKEFPKLKVDFIKTCGQVHDRFIMLDYGESAERVFHCGASSKDAGYKMTVITEIEDGTIRRALGRVFDAMLNNPKLILG